MNRRNVSAFWAALCCVALVAGCFGDHSIAGGTQGVLRAKGEAVRDVRIDVYPAGASEPIGFGVTTDGGRFELYQPGATDALHLPPGEYALTLESVGPEPLSLAPALGDREKTPLRTHWTGTETVLELSIP